MAKKTSNRPSFALVTGAPGFLGTALVHELLSVGVKVRAMALPGENTDHLDASKVEIVFGDIRDIEAVRQAVAGVDTVFHAAAVYKDYIKDPGLMYDVNANGTFNMLEAARRAKVKRVIYTASVVSLGRPEAGQLGDENTAYEAWDIDFPYGRSKFVSRQIAERFAAWGLDVRIVCPSVIIGPGDRVPTPSGALLLRVARGEMPAYIVGGAAHVDVRDAARVHWLAALHGKRGECYIAGGQNLTGKDLLETVAAEVGEAKEFPKIPIGVARFSVRAQEAWALRRGREPEMTRTFFEYGLKSLYYSSDKAITELGATFRPSSESIRDAIADFRERGILEL